MLNKLLAKASELALKGRKPATAPVTPDISRVIKPAPQAFAAVQPPMVAHYPSAIEVPAHEMPAEAAPEILAAASSEELAGKAEDAVGALTDSFDAWMRDDLAKLRSAWADALAESSSTEAYRELYTCAHNIRGAAASYGYPAVSRLCGSLCTLLGNSKPGENSALIQMHVDACRAAVAAGPQGEGSESVADAVCNALETQVAGKLSAAG
jgi:HPt (histidine-containing phosphotransfer) domain-containing protein